MKINQDCMRDVLLSLEENLQLTVEEDGLVVFSGIPVSFLYNVLPQYSKEDIFYTVTMLSDANLIVIKSKRVTGGVLYCTILQMTYEGHQFLDRVRDPERWKNTKKVLAAVRDFSLDAIRAVTDGLTSAALSRFLPNP